MRAAAFILVAAAGCASSSAPDPGLEGLALTSVAPGEIIPGTKVVVTGSSFVDAQWGAGTLHLIGTAGSQDIDVQWPLTFVDFSTMTVVVQRSHERSTTKGGHVDTLPIHPQLAPYLAHAHAASGSEFLFPSANGKQRNSAINMARLTQKICVWAGLVEGYEHKCRRCKASGTPRKGFRPSTPSLCRGLFNSCATTSSVPIPW